MQRTATSKRNDTDAVKGDLMLVDNCHDRLGMFPVDHDIVKIKNKN